MEHLQSEEPFSSDPYFRAVLLLRSGKKSPRQETGLRNRGRLKVLDDAKLILNDKVGHSSLISQASFLPWTFFAASYSKIALAST